VTVSALVFDPHPCRWAPVHCLVPVQKDCLDFRAAVLVVGAAVVVQRLAKLE
jgi:hypothetical protein